MICRGIPAAMLALALCTGCIPERPWPDAARDPWPAESAALDSLRAEGRWDDALALASRRLARVERFAGQPRWRLQDAQREAATLRHVLTLPDVARTELAQAEQALHAIGHDHERDSLGAGSADLRSALATRERWLGAGHAQTASARLALAWDAFHGGRVAESDSMCERALATFQHAVGPDHPFVADAEDLSGHLLKNFSGGRAARLASIARHSRAMRIRVVAFGPQSGPVASSCEDLANVYRLLHAGELSLELLRAALDVLPDDREHADEIAGVHTAMAFLLASRAHWDDAQREAATAVAIRTRDSTVARAPSLALALGLRGCALRRMGRLPEALDALGQAVAIRETAWVRSHHDEGSGIMLDMSMYCEVAIAQALAGRGDEAFATLERGQSRMLAEQLLGERAIAGDPWRDVLARVRRVLPPDAAIVCWPRLNLPVVVGDYPRWACIVRSDGAVRWRALPALPHRPRTTLVSRESYVIELKGAAAWPLRATENRLVRDMAQRAWREWFAPLEGDLAGVRELVVTSPDLVFNLPVGAFLDDRGRWLGDRFTVSYAPSALLYARGREQDRMRRPAAGTAVLIGDPAFAARDPGHWARLTGSRDEVEAIASTLERPTLLTGADASARHVRALASSGALGRFALVHVATHAEIDARHPLESALVLAPDAAADTFNSRLSGREIARDWHLDADLVSLATCRSIQGFSSPADGQLGLHQAFLAAGAHALLVSLWPVDDGATALLMRHFYETLAHTGAASSRADALRSAQRWLREWTAADGSHPYAHPAYWAPFVLIGDPGG